MALHLTGGERHDLLGVAPLFEQAALRTGRRGRPRWKPATVIADKAYSAAWLLDILRRKDIVPIIPNRVDQPSNPEFNREAYRQRNLVERLVGKLKQFRRVATRYDKLAGHYLGFVQIAALMIWLRSFGDTAWADEPPWPAGSDHPPDPIPSTLAPGMSSRPSRPTGKACSITVSGTVSCPIRGLMQGVREQ